MSSHMTNMELDRWLAVNVMGKPPEDLRRMQIYGCEDCDQWHPTENIAQAIEVAEKARADGRIRWYELMSPHSPTGRGATWEANVDREFDSAQAESASEALCCILYAALMETP